MYCILIPNIFFPPIQPPFEENGIASPIDDQSKLKAAQATQNGSGGNNSINNLSSSIDSAVLSHHQQVQQQQQQQQQLHQQQQQNGIYPKNRFLSGDHVAGREAMMRRQMYPPIGKCLHRKRGASSVNPRLCPSELLSASCITISELHLSLIPLNIFLSSRRLQSPRESLPKVLAHAGQ